MADIKKPPDMISGKHDCSDVSVFSFVHEICVGGAASKPFASCMSFSDEMVQLYRLSCWANGQGKNVEETTKSIIESVRLQLMAIKVKKSTGG
ncbi:hypothetical protein Tco_0760457 [Tanacetum coccineum]